MSELPTGNDTLLGRLAVHAKYITADQLAQATRTQSQAGNPNARLGDTLVALSFITEEQRTNLLDAQQRYLARKRKTQPPKSRADADRPPRKRTISQVIAQPDFKTAEKRQIDTILTHAVGIQASDVHIHAGSPIMMRINGDLVRGRMAALSPDQTKQLVLDVLDDEQRKTFAEELEIDFAFEIQNIGRFRVNAYHQRNGVNAIFRTIPIDPPSLADLGLPSALARFTNFNMGMVLATGPAGCGKSATFAALVNLVNEERREHIITIEDPVEILHRSKRCMVSQRQVVTHTESFASALRAALREDCDTVAIGELRDVETMSLAITAAETGHLVYGTMHTNGCVQTIDRLINVFPPRQQLQIRTVLSESVRAIISQRLVKSADGTKRHPALEVLVVTRAVANLIRENKIVQIETQMKTGRHHGMILLDDSLRDMIEKGKITKGEALKHCHNRRNFA